MALNQYFLTGRQYAGMYDAYVKIPSTGITYAKAFKGNSNRMGFFGFALDQVVKDGGISGLVKWLASNGFGQVANDEVFIPLKNTTMSLVQQNKQTAYNILLEKNAQAKAKLSVQQKVTNPQLLVIQQEQARDLAIHQAKAQALAIAQARIAQANTLAQARIEQAKAKLLAQQKAQAQAKLLVQPPYVVPIGKAPLEHIITTAPSSSYENRQAHLLLNANTQTTGTNLQAATVSSSGKPKYIVLLVGAAVLLLLIGNRGH